MTRKVKLGQHTKYCLKQVLEADLADDNPVGEISLKCCSTNTQNLEGCAEITVAKVNPEIWSQMNNFKRKIDLRVDNTQ